METVAQSDAGRARVALVDEISHHLGVTTPGLTVMLGHEDTSQYPNPKYSKDAFHMNIQEGGVEDASPTYVLDVMTSPACTHFIWVNQTIVDGSELCFIWIVSHELGHHIQDIRGDTSGPANDFIRAVGRRVLGNVTALAVPSELEAEMSAKKTLLELRGPEGYSQHKNAEAAQGGEKASSYFEDLEARELRWAGTLEEQTRAVLASRPMQFRRELTRLQAKDKFLNLDLESWLPQ